MRTLHDDWSIKLGESRSDRRLKYLTAVLIFNCLIRRIARLV